MSELKPCPCGKVPTELSIQDGSTYRWRYVGCPCNEWWIEARVDLVRRDDAGGIRAECERAWNDSPRADLHSLRLARRQCLPDEVVERLRGAVWSAKENAENSYSPMWAEHYILLRDILAAVEGKP